MKEQLRIVHGSYDEPGEEQLNDYNLEVYKQDILYIQGGSDSGIHSLANILAGDRRLKGGKLFLEGKQVEDYTRNTAFYYRIYSTAAEHDLVETMTVAENLEAVRYIPFAFMQYHDRNARQEAKKYLRQCKIDVRPDAYIWELDGKERVKLNVLKARMHGAHIVILDITKGNYIGQEAEEIAEMIRNANADGVTFVILSEKYSYFAEIATRIQLMDHGIDIKEWDHLDERIRLKLMNIISYPFLNEKKEGLLSDRLADLGIYDYEWGLHESIWEYLDKLHYYNRTIWDDYIHIQIPDKGSSRSDDAVIIPYQSERMLMPNLNVSDHLIMGIPDRVSRSPIAYISKNIQDTITRRFYEDTGIDTDKKLIQDMNRVERKLLSIYRWELQRPDTMVLENPFTGFEYDDIERIKRYLGRFKRKNIRIILLSRSLEQLKRDCHKVIVAHNTKIAKIATN